MKVYLSLFQYTLHWIHHVCVCVCVCALKMSRSSPPEFSHFRCAFLRLEIHRAVRNVLRELSVHNQRLDFATLRVVDILSTTRNDLSVIFEAPRQK